MQLKHMIVMAMSLTLAACGSDTETVLVTQSAYCQPSDIADSTNPAYQVLPANALNYRTRPIFLTMLRDCLIESTVFESPMDVDSFVSSDGGYDPNQIVATIQQANARTLHSTTFLAPLKMKAGLARIEPYYISLHRPAQGDTSIHLAEINGIKIKNPKAFAHFYVTDDFVKNKADVVVSSYENTGWYDVSLSYTDGTTPYALIQSLSLAIQANPGDDVGVCLESTCRIYKADDRGRVILNAPLNIFLSPYSQSVTIPVEAVILDSQQFIVGFPSDVSATADSRPAYTKAIDQ